MILSVGDNSPGSTTTGFSQAKYSSRSSPASALRINSPVVIGAGLLRGWRLSSALILLHLTWLSRIHGDDPTYPGLVSDDCCPITIAYFSNVCIALFAIFGFGIDLNERGRRDDQGPLAGTKHGSLPSQRGPPYGTRFIFRGRCWRDSNASSHRGEKPSRLVICIPQQEMSGWLLAEQEKAWLPTLPAST